MSEVRQRMQQLRADIAEASTEALQEAAERILAASDADLPVGDPEQDPDRTASLIANGEISLDPEGRTATIRYRGPYAAKQHEARSFEHPRGGKSKFLEDALKAEIPQLGGVVAGKVRARVTRRH
jgi:hypothetical protein